MISFPPIFRTPAFAWACAVLASGSLAAALLLVARRPLRGLADGFLSMPPLRRTLAALVVAAAVACAGGKGEGVSSKEQGVSAEDSSEEVVSSKEQVVSADLSSSVVAEGGAEKKEGNVHTYSLLPTTYSLTDEDISRGYRLVSVVTNEAHSYAMPADARLVGTWHLTDAYDAVVKVGLDVWEFGRLDVGGLGRGEMFRFPLGGQVVTSLWAHVWGKARPQLWNASNELVAVGAPMCARRGVSRLWTVATTNGSVLLTWQDFFFKGVSSKEQGAREKGVSSKEQVVSVDDSSSVVAADGAQLDVAHHTYSLLLPPSSLSQRSLLPPPFSLISAQLELFRDGSFVARSNSVARVYRRVDPDDWDGDGIPNGEDDDPRVAADEPRFGPRQSLPPGAHTNNYCWIDLAVRDADALVSFAGDAPSDLPDPSFVAKAGETNRVTLLIGKAYTVCSLLPVEVVGKSSDAVEVRQEADGTLRLLWPVEIGVMEGDGDEEACAGGGDEGVSSKEQGVSAGLSSSVVAADGTEREKGNVHTYSLLLPPYSLTSSPSSLTSSPSSFTMALTPPWLVGSFAWTNVCCRVAGDGLVFSLACGGECACGGCAATGYFAYEGYRLPARGGACPCGGSGGAVVPGEEDDEEPDPLPGASARFEKRVILFEDEYEDAPGVAVPWRSTEDVWVFGRLDVWAFGLATGGLQ